MVNTFNQEFNIRSKWPGLTYLRKAYSPGPWFRLNDKNKPEALSHLPEATATHLEKHQWGVAPAVQAEGAAPDTHQLYRHASASTKVPSHIQKLTK